MTAILPQNSGKMECAPAAPANTFEQPGHLAHDARNCLTVLRVYCDLLRSSGAIRKGYEPWMDELAGAVERGQNLMDSLLDSVAASRPMGLRREDHDADVAPNAEPHRPEQPDLVTARCVDIAAAVRRRLPVLKRMAGEKVRVEVHAPLDVGAVPLSEGDFERILYNLAGNAIEAMPQGGTLRILLNSGRFATAIGEALDMHLQHGEDTVSFCIADSGTGIDPEWLPQIFEAGFSGQRNGEEHPERHGFGLAIVRELTERAGGDVRVYSQPGCGSLFEVKLPAA